MDGWFTIEEIDGGTFAISEYRHWEETHCYLLCGDKRAALIDTGLGIGNIRSAVESLTSLPVMVLTTHAHWDHIGGHRQFDFIACHEEERDWMAVRFPLPLFAVKQSLMREPHSLPPEFDIEKYQIFRGTPQMLLHGGERMELGNRRLEVIHTPGHSPGHCCFYEPERRYLYSGDLIYSGCLDAFYPTTDPQMFLRSLEKVGRLPAERVLPGHHRLDIPADIVKRTENAFQKLNREGCLRHGCGVFDFGDFQIHV